MTKQEKVAKANIVRYNESKAQFLGDVYGKCSDAKEKAWTDCVSLMNDMHGYNFRIISYNVFMFTAGFLVTDTDTGVVKFVYITPSYTTIIDY